MNVLLLTFRETLKTETFHLWINWLDIRVCEDGF
jgi:hypothetical protein